MKRMPRSFGCPVELSLELLRGKWKPVILARLKDGPLRYGELRRLIPRLSDKVLTERLADLQAQGLIARESRERGGGYRLSPRGESVRPLLQALYDWGAAQANELMVDAPPITPGKPTSNSKRLSVGLTGSAPVAGRNGRTGPATT